MTTPWLVLVSALVTVAPAQERIDAQLSGMPSVLGERLIISIVTVGPGPKIASHFGHTAIRVIDRGRGTDLLYDYGHFDRDADRFLIRFLSGRMQYWMEARDAKRELRRYGAKGRLIQIQTLNLTPPQRIALRDFLEWNVRPENRAFTYDYFRDNCTTRVRDALNLVLDGALRSATDSLATQATYRGLTLNAWRSHPTLGQGVSVFLGRSTDRPLSAWDVMFLPHLLFEGLDEIDVAGQPVVQATYIVSESADVGMVKAGIASGVITIGIILAVVLLACGKALDTSRKARLIFSVVASGWGLLVGASGTLIAGLWTLTDHWAAGFNENILALNPLALAACVLLPLWTYRRSWANRPTVIVTVVLAGLSLAGLALQVTPGFDQSNGVALAAVLPGHLALAITVLASRDGGRAVGR